MDAEVDNFSIEGTGEFGAGGVLVERTGSAFGFRHPERHCMSGSHD
jgi:hypothetical protein